MKTKNLTLFLYADALNYSCLDCVVMPFLSKIAESCYQCLDNVFGYSFAIQSSMLSGKYPDENGFWMPYYFSPELSPLFFKTFGQFSRAFNLDKSPKLQFLLLKQSRRLFLKKGAPCNNVPSTVISKLAVYPYYYMCELPFFGELENLMWNQTNTKLTYVGPPEFRASIYEHLIKHIKSTTFENEFILAYDDKLDSIGHKFGPNSKEYFSYVRILDKTLSLLYEKLSRHLADRFRLVVFSDHGQCERTLAVNIFSIINRLGIRIGEDYLCFIDATIALFWPNNERARKLILTILSKSKLGTVVSPELRKRYHISFREDAYGEIIFALKPGIIFFPNFFNPFSAMKGLHGFLPEESVQKAFMVSDNCLPYDCHHVKDFRNLALHLASNY